MKYTLKRLKGRPVLYAAGCDQYIYIMRQTDPIATTIEGEDCPYRKGVTQFLVAFDDELKCVETLDWVLWTECGHAETGKFLSALTKLVAAERRTRPKRKKAR